MIFISSKVSDGNMSSFTGNIKQALQNKDKFFLKNKINPKNVIEAKQVHNNKVIRVMGNSLDKNIEDGDALITGLPNIFLMVKAADCNQIGLYDSKNQVIGLIHAGYKGLDKQIIKRTIQKMKKTLKTSPKDLIIQFGPSIGPCHYQINIWEEAEKQLLLSEVLKENIHNPKICTYENTEYFSHRRAEDNNEPDLRFATLVGI